MALHAFVHAMLRFAGDTAGMPGGGVGNLPVEALAAVAAKIRAGEEE